MRTIFSWELEGWKWELEGGKWELEQESFFGFGGWVECSYFLEFFFVDFFIFRPAVLEVCYNFRKLFFNTG